MARVTIDKKPWKIRRNTHGGLMIETRLPDGRRIASFPTIPKWYHKPLWPWVFWQSIKAIQLQEEVVTNGTV